QRDLQKAQTEIETVHGQLEKMRGEIGARKEEVGAAKSEVAKIEAVLIKKEADLAATREQLTALEARREAAGQEAADRIAELKSRVEQGRIIKEELDVVRRRLEGAEAALRDRSDEVQRLSGAMDAKEQELKAALD